MIQRSDDRRIVITGIGVTSPLGNTLPELRANLLAGKSGVQEFETRYVGKTLAGICDFDDLKYQKRKEVRRGTRAGSIAIYCAREALADAHIELSDVEPQRVGVYIGTTEHGNVETENEINEIKQYDYDVKYWTHHHNPRTVANNPAGEVTLNLKLTGPHYTIGAACAAGNAGLIQGMQMLWLDECDLALAGGVSESIHTFGIFAGFKSQGALACHDDPAKASRPFDTDRNGIVVAEGGGIVTLERLSDAKKRGATIYAEIVGHGMNSDAVDFVLPNPTRQAECMRLTLKRAGISASEVDILSTHATSTKLGDQHEAHAVRDVFANCPRLHVNNTKSFLGHAMGAAGVIELFGNLPSFTDKKVHPTINLDHLDAECEMPGLVVGEPCLVDEVTYILNNSFGMLGINSALLVRRYDG
ncbi:3-oxoacyl-[acyl-carrier-protein] synthase 2 [Planctomycetes bacterium Pan216]|uniref:3-oxoacyl-[acyl-carrier-protein] synthase 2 n=1 Tax=Kolteria novifilia TaxID=2527975 RepID=A0A518BB45_9BACT|nr:3-oxoacyl-[acyl-carrier-protein] synthase 2 [Planctomycetes bacterium Pan216]